MGYVWLLVLVALGVSLFNFFDSRDLSRLTATAFEQRNKRYGAYNMRRDYSHVMLLILSIMLVVCVFGIGTQKDFWMNQDPPKMARQVMDTTLLSLNTPPEDLEPTLPPSYTIKSDQGNGGQDAADQEKKEEIKETPEDVRDPQNEPQKTNPESSQQPEQPIKDNTKVKYADPNDPEQYRNAGSDAIAQAKARAEERRRKEEQRKQDAMQKQGNNVKGQNGQAGSVPKNQPMVDFSLNGRTPYENDIYWVRNPGYTCGKGEGGTVVVAIKVNANGNVIEASPTGDYKNSDDCIVLRALEYARKSRFNASNKSVQEGTITYKYKPQ